MEFLTASLAGEDVFRSRPGEFSTLNAACMYCSSESTSINLQDYIQQFGVRQNVSCGDILLIPLGNRVLDTKVDELACLSALWGIPPAAAYDLLSSDLSGCYRQKVDDIEYIWYGLPVSNQMGEAGHMKLLICAGKISGTYVLYTLIISPKYFITQVQSLIRSYKANFTFDLSSAFETLRFQTLLAGEALRSWRSHYTLWSIAIGVTLQGIVQTEKVTLSGNRLSECDGYLAELKLFAEYQTIIQKSLERIEKDCSLHNAAMSAFQLRQSVRNLCERSMSLKKDYNFLAFTLGIKRESLVSLIQANNGQYVRTNTIALRRLAELSRQETEQVQILAQASQKDSYDMKKLAYLTMIYLPGTFVATFFSMPFMALSDDLSFKAYEKLWVYFLVSGILTFITFVMSFFWDHMKRPLQIQQQVSRPAADIGEQTNPENVDRHLLEPPGVAEPDTDTLLRQLAEKFFPNSNTGTRDTDDDGGENNADNQEQNQESEEEEDVIRESEE